MHVFTAEKSANKFIPSPTELFWVLLQICFARRFVPVEKVGFCWSKGEKKLARNHLKVLYHRQYQYTQANEYHFDGLKFNRNCEPQV